MVPALRSWAPLSVTAARTDEPTSQVEGLAFRRKIRQPQIDVSEIGGRGQRQCRHGDGGDPDRDRRRRAHLDVCRMGVAGEGLSV